MSRGIREIALSDDDDEKDKEENKHNKNNHEYNPYPYHNKSFDKQENFNDYNDYKPDQFENEEDWNPRYASPDPRSAWEMAPLEKGQFKIEIIIPIKDCGKVGDINRENYDTELMLKTAEKLAIMKLKELSPEIDKKYSYKVSNEENIDTVTIFMIVKPKKSLWER